MKGLDQRCLGRWGVQYLAAIDRNHYLSTVRHVWLLALGAAFSDGPHLYLYSSLGMLFHSYIKSDERVSSSRLGPSSLCLLPSCGILMV